MEELIFDYSPLPPEVELRPSEIHGYGIFTKDTMYRGDIVGVSHVYDEEIGLIRTPLGGFVNHDPYPNCIINITGRIWLLIADSKVLWDEDLTVNYKEYALCGYKTKSIEDNENQRAGNTPEVSGCR